MEDDRIQFSHGVLGRELDRIVPLGKLNYISNYLLQQSTAGSSIVVSHRKIIIIAVQHSHIDSDEAELRL